MTAADLHPVPERDAAQTLPSPADQGADQGTDRGALGEGAALAPTMFGDRVEMVTFGCRLNAYESEAMKMAAGQAGLANAVIVNTCAVTGEAVRQARQAIRRARRERPDARIIVTGCAAQIDPDAFAAMAEVDQVLGNADKTSADAWARLTGPVPPRAIVNDIMSVTQTAGHLVDGLLERARAYVQVQNGCDHRCTFCVIPFGRGNSRSVPAGEIITQIQRLVDKGFNEVVLTGVDLTSWGADLPGQPPLGNLVARILKLVPDLARLRLSSLDAIEMDEALFEAFASQPRLAPYLHLSLQHGANLILKRMKRRHGREEALALVERVRAARPDTAFGADLIAGFPTETEAHARDNESLIEAAGLAFVHVFPFSPRPMTPAANMPQLDKALIKERAARLRAAGAAALARHLASLVGLTSQVLLEKPGFGRLADFTPVQISDAGAEAGALGQIGGFLAVRTHGHTPTQLLAQVVS